jgi:transposase
MIERNDLSESLAAREQLLSRDHEIEHLKLLIAKLRRMQFGRKSEKVERQIEQLELKLEDLEAIRAEAARPPAIEPSSSQPASSPKKRSALPDHLPREIQTHQPEQHSCPECGGTLKKLGEDVSEILEWVPASFKVIRQVRPKLCCTGCDVIVQAPAPIRPIDRGMAGPGLLAHVLTSKFADHLPLYRQSEIYAREGVELDCSTLAKWVGEASHLLVQLVEALRRYVLAADKLHGDDIPVPVLARGNGKTKTGRLWTYVRDDRPAGSTAAPAVWFAYSPDRKGERPQQHLSKFIGILQADAYAGFNKLYEDGNIQEAPCLAHIRRKFFDLMEAHKSPIATEAVERTAPLYEIEEEIRGRSPDERREVRNRKARRCWSRCANGWKLRCRNSRVSPIRRRQSTTRSPVGMLSCATAMMAASRSTTQLPKEPCAQWPWAAATIFSLVPIAAASARLCVTASLAQPSSTD